MNVKRQNKSGRRKMVESGKVEQELLDRIDRVLHQPIKVILAGKTARGFPIAKKKPSENERATQILILIKEALPELAKEAGYIQLADEQQLPDQFGKTAYERLKAFIIFFQIDEFFLDAAIAETQMDMLTNGWRRIKLEEK